MNTKKLTENQLAVLVAGVILQFPHAEPSLKLKQLATVDGWTFSYEYPGIFTFTKGNFVVCATPDYMDAGVIDIQASMADGRELGGTSLRYLGDLTPERYVELVRPFLRTRAH